MKKRLIKLVAVSSIFSLSAVAGFTIAGCGPDDEHTHNLSEVAAVEATCTTNGTRSYWLCDGCELIFADSEGTTELSPEDIVIEKLGHDMTKHEAQQGDCTTEGNIEYYTCSREPGVYYADAEGTLVLQSVTTSASHELEYHSMVYPTTESEGVNEYWECTVCGRIFADRYADVETTLEDLSIAKVNEDIDGTLTETFYNTDNAIVIGGEDVLEGGKGIIVNAVKADDGVYLHIRVNYDVATADTDSAHGKIGVYFNVRNTEDYNLPGGAGVCLEQAMLMELYLDGYVDYHQPYSLLYFAQNENASDSKTNYTSIWEMFIPNSGFATVNGGVFSEAFETTNGVTTLKSGYNFLITAIGNMSPNDTFISANGSVCSLMDSDTWAFWYNQDHADWGTDQKYYALGADGITETFQRVTDTYQVNLSVPENAKAEGFGSTVDYDGTLSGTITVGEGYILSGIEINGQLFTTFSSDPDTNTYEFSIAVSDITSINWNDTSIDVEIIITQEADAKFNITAYETDGETEVTLENGTEITFTGKYAAYTYIVGETETITMIPGDYEVFLYGYGKEEITIGANDSYELKLIKTIAYASTDKVTIDSEAGTISIASGSKNSNSEWNGSAEIVISEEIGTDFVFETTIKMSDVTEGWNEYSTEQRYAIRLTESGKGFYLWSWRNGGVSNTYVRELASLTNCMTEGETVNGDESGNGWMYDALISETGLQVRVIRLGSKLILTAMNNGEYVTIGTIECDADDATLIEVFGVTAGFEYSSNNVKVLTYVEARDATAESAGNIAHYTDGTNYYLPDGSVVTEEEVFIPKL